MRALTSFFRKRPAARGGRKPARPRQSTPFRLPRWLRRGAVAAVVGAGLVGGGYTLWHSGVVADGVTAVRQAYRDAVQGVGLAVDKIELVGISRSDAQDIRAALGFGRGTLMVDVDPEAVRDRLLALGWVAEASVSRQLPDTVRIELREREPFAIWQQERKFALIGRDGTIITTSRLERFADLFLVVGAGADRHVAEIVDLLEAQPELRQRARAAVWVGDRRWNLRFENGVDVRLPAEGAAGALARLALLDREHGILDRKIGTIDLRLSDRLIVQLLEAAKETTKDRRPTEKSGKDT